MVDSYKIVYQGEARRAGGEEVRFIADLSPVSDEEEALDFMRGESEKNTGMQGTTVLPIS